MRQAVSKPTLATLAELRPIGLEDLPAVRHLHAASFKQAAAARLSETEIAAFARHVTTPAYMDELLNQDLTCAFVCGELVGTSGWCPADDRGTTARIRAVFVRPLFTREGIGEKLVRHAEARVGEVEGVADA